MASILEKVLRTGDKKVLGRLRSYAEAINSLEDGFREFTDAELRAETDEFRKRVADGESLDRLLPEAFAVVREASARVLGKRHYDVQLMGGAALHLGNIAEMKTGEGKTLVATAPAYLNALSGQGVHVITVNDYLASSQAEQMGRVYRFLGLETGTIVAQQSPEVRRKQYAADITYGTNNEFGFDYLRDNMAWSVDELVQRGHGFAIVDEVDSILIDEARTPLIISGPASGEANRWYSVFANLVEKLNLDEDYEADEKKRTVSVLEPGIDKVEDWLGIENLYDTANTPLIGFLNNALKARELFSPDKDYVVMKGEVQIVDEHTGRILKGRRYNEGVHQAIEAKERVKVKPENQTMATITLQNYFRLYDKLGGMTGTAETEAAEFMNTYELGVVAIETNRPMIRKDHEDLVYKNEVVKFAAVVQDIEQRHRAGQPVLVGTTSVEKSEYLSKLLSKRGVRHEVLNAKNNEHEAGIVAQAGRRGSVTVATNMAGRGTDIILGGNAEAMAMERMRQRGLDPEQDPERYEQEWPAVLAAAEDEIGDEHEQVRDRGGLYVLGTERHESRRIDNQLRGRAGRQGDPGESRFYLSLSDDLMRLFNAGGASRLMANAAEDTALEFRIVSRAIASAQNMVEGRNAEQRKNVLKYDDVLNRQRTAIYSDRRQILEGHDLQEQIRQFTREVVGSIVVDKTSSGHPEDWDLDALWDALKTVYPVSVTQEELIDEVGGREKLSTSFLREQIVSDAEVVYEEREEQIGAEAMRNLERRVLLSVLGRRWPEHLYEMDYLKDGIGLRAMAQRDPLVEYQREGHIMYETLMGAIREETVTQMFAVDLSKVRAGTAGGALPANLPKQPKFLQYSAPSETGGAQVRTESSAAVAGVPARHGATGSSAANAGGRSGQSVVPGADGPGAGKAETDGPEVDSPEIDSLEVGEPGTDDPGASPSHTGVGDDGAPRSRAERRAAEARGARASKKQRKKASGKT